MDMEWLPEDMEIRDRSREFTRKFLYPYEEELDETDVTNDETEELIRQKVIEYGLNAINHRKEFGGQEMSTVQYCIVSEEVGASTNALWARVWLPPICLTQGTPEQIEKYLIPACRGDHHITFTTSEPTAGSDAGGIKTSAVLDGDHYVINGEKCFASRSDVAEVNLLTTIADGDSSKPTLFIVDHGTPGYNIRRCPRFSQRSGRNHPEVDIVDMRVPVANRLGEVGQGFEMTKDWFVEARMAIGARSIGMAVRAMDLAVEWAKEREQFGNKIINYQGVEFMIADMAADIMAGKSMLYRLAAEMDHGLDRKIAHGKASAIKLFCSEAAFRVVDKAFQIFGGRGGMCENPVERLTRDVRYERIWEGTTEIQKIVMAKQIKKRGHDMYTGWN
ncbi:MAG: acyl-CoA dehydrogenase family protein [Alphaproteobacteria bacterium]